METTFTTPTPFEAGKALGSVCESINCGTFNKELLLTDYFPALVGFLFFVPVIVVLVSFFTRQRTESDFLKPQTSPRNITILLLLSLTIAAVFYTLFYYV